MKTLEKAIDIEIDICKNALTDRIEAFTWYDLEHIIPSIFKAGAKFAQTWISTDDELPEPGQKVFFKIDETILCGWFDGNIFQYDFYGMRYSYKKGVTEWRPVEYK
ncbi:MAG: hypothetical protein LBE36_13510 [Flavobacteriaceae bacterium]|jgi:hypothetical protein|nr:hypothetical protein [Flavobacteriaceae bacterium]